MLDRRAVGELLGARTVEVPPRLLRGGMGLAGWAHLVPASPQLFDVVMQLPPLAPETSGPLRSHEAATGVGSRP